MRIVLLGNRDAGKSSAGNTILGREEFDPDVRTLQCVKRQGEVAGRQVTVVDTPGWKDYDLSYDRDSPGWGECSKDSPNLLKQEIVLSVTLCPPGPHVFLLVIHENMTFTEAERNATSNHLNLVGHEAWKHSLVLFIKETPAEENHVEVKGEMVQQLVNTCENRYHVLNIKYKNKMQVTELLEKIEEMVARNRGRHYEINRDILQKVEEKRAEEERRAEERRKKVHRRAGGALLPELRIVLLGFKDAGKSSSGNTILGREEFQPGQRSAVCVKRQGEVAGRQVTVVEAPGWWKNINLKHTPKLTKQEIVLSVSLCPPGPHILLLLVRVDDHFTEDKKQIIQEHLELLSDRVWSHTMVLFTCGDWLGDTSIEQYIASEEHLGCLLEKCGNRYHVLNNVDKGDKTQITELMEKMEEIIAGNGGRHFEMDRKRVEEMKERRKQHMQRAEDRLVGVYKQTSVFQFSGGDGLFLSSMRVVLLGYRGSGKSSSGKTILRREEFDLKRTIAQCVKRQGEVAGRQVTVVEAPGWWNNDSLKDTPELTKQRIMQSLSLCPPGPHAVLLVIRVDYALAEDYIKSIQDHLELLGKHIWSHTIVLFTYGDWLGDTTIEQHIESEGETLRWIIEKCGNRYHVLNNKDRTDDTQVTELLEKIEQMVVSNGGVHYERPQEEERKEKMDKKSRWSVYRGKRPDDQSREKKLSLQESIETPPDMGEDDRSGVFTEETSGYGTNPPPTPPGESSRWSSVEYDFQEHCDVSSFQGEMTGPPYPQPTTYTSQTQHLNPPQNETL